MTNEQWRLLPRRIALVTPYPEEAGVITGGVEGAAFALISGLRCIGQFDIHVIAPNLRRGKCHERRAEAEVHWIPPPRLPWFLSYWGSYRRQVFDCLELIQPDVVHFQGVAGWSVNCRFPHVLTIHGINELDVLHSEKRFSRIRSKVVAAVENYARRRQRETIIISPYVERILSQSIGGRRWHIENPVMQDWFDLKHRPDDSSILFAGRISPRKNVLNLLAAFSSIVRSNPKATLRLAGSGDASFLEACHAEIDKHGMAKSVAFLGNLGRHELQAEVSRAAVLILPSRQETAPLIIAECMAAGTPIVAAAVCGIPDMIVHGETGYLVDPDSLDDIANQVQAVLTDGERAARIAERAHKVAHERFHYVEVAKRTLNVYAATLASKRQSIG